MHPSPTGTPTVDAGGFSTGTGPFRRPLLGGLAGRKKKKKKKPGPRSGHPRGRRTVHLADAPPPLPCSTITAN